MDLALAVTPLLRILARHEAFNGAVLTDAALFFPSHVYIALNDALGASPSELNRVNLDHCQVKCDPGNPFCYPMLVIGSYHSTNGHTAPSVVNTRVSGLYKSPEGRVDTQKDNPTIGSVDPKTSTDH